MKAIIKLFCFSYVLCLVVVLLTIPAAWIIALQIPSVNDPSNVLMPCILIIPILAALLLVGLHAWKTRHRKSDPYRFETVNRRYALVPINERARIKEGLETLRAQRDGFLILSDDEFDFRMEFRAVLVEGQLCGLPILQKRILIIHSIIDEQTIRLELLCKPSIKFMAGDLDSWSYHLLENAIDALGLELYLRNAEGKPIRRDWSAI